MIISEPEASTRNKEELRIDVPGIKKVAFLVRAVNHPVRLSLLRIISRAGEITVTQMRSPLNLIQPVASSHLAVLRKAGVVATRREGHRVLYSVRHDRLELLHQCIQKYIR